MSEPRVRVDFSGSVATLTLDDPARLNAMSEALGRAFAARVAELAREPELRAVVLRGEGRAFCAGGDLAMIQARADQARTPEGEAAVRRGMREFYELFLSIRDLPCPTIAALHGSAIGAGLCVALACDLRIAAEDAKLGLNFTKLGLEPGMAATWTLPRLVGSAAAAELLYTGRNIDGIEAARLGLVNRAVPAARVLPEAQALAAEIAATSPLANRAIKRSLARSASVPLDDQIAFEAREQAACFASEDVQEGLAAARERRPPRFTGR